MQSRGGVSCCQQEVGGSGSAGSRIRPFFVLSCLNTFSLVAAPSQLGEKQGVEKGEKGPIIHWSGLAVKIN